MTALQPHPDSPLTSVRGIDAAAELTAFGDLTLSYTLDGDIASLRIPATAMPRHRDGLWRQTCFEAFIGTAAAPAYLEFNFSPSGEWAAYTFRAYRDGAVLELDAPPEISCEIDADRLRLTATVASEYLPKARRLRLGLSAVIEDVDGRIGHWALRHPPGKPDFHHTDAFALELDLV
jgi:hypothetical protein